MWGIFRKHLVVKLGLVLVFTIVVGFAIPAIFNAGYQLESMEQMQNQSASSLSRGLSAGIRNAMLTGNGITARQLVGEVRADISHVQMHIFSNEGEEVFGDKPPPPPEGEIPQHVRDVIESEESLILDNGYNVFPIPTEPRCNQCHDPNETMRGVLTISSEGAKKQLANFEDTLDTITDIVKLGFINLMATGNARLMTSYFLGLGEDSEHIDSIAVYSTEKKLSLGDDFMEVDEGKLDLALRVKSSVKYTEDGILYDMRPLVNEKRCHACHKPEPALRGILVVAYEPEEVNKAEAIFQTLRASLRSVMLSGLGRFINHFLDSVGKLGIVSHLTLHDNKGRLFHDTFTRPTPSPLIASVLKKKEPVTEYILADGVKSFAFAAPLMNDKKCRRCHGEEEDLRGAVEVRLDVTEQVAQRRQLAQVGMVSSIATVGAVLLLLFIGLRLLVIRPVSEVGDVAEAVGKGDLSIQVNIRSVDEIGRLGERVNHMIMELRQKLALTKFVSGATLKSIESSGGIISLGGDRRRVTVLFSDIRGFTSFSETREPEEVVGMLNRYLNVQAKVVHKYGGDIDKFVGDEVMAYFIGDDMEKRAAQCAIELIEVVSAESERILGEYKHIDIGVGINVGEMVMGAMGSIDRMDFTLIGDAVNLGARLCSKALPKQILISEDVARAIGEEFEAEELMPIEFKGKSKPIKVFWLK